VKAPRVLLPLSIHSISAPSVVLNLGRYTLYSSIHKAATTTVPISHNREIDVTHLYGENITIQLSSTATNFNELSIIETIVVPFTLSGRFYHHHHHHHSIHSTALSSNNSSINTRYYFS
jgi:hypothetical protein